jgi:hypothetical protein
MSITVSMTKTIKIINPDEVMSSAKHWGVQSGRGDDWEPESLEEAIEELELVGEGGPLANGYEVIDQNTHISLPSGKMFQATKLGASVFDSPSEPGRYSFITPDGIKSVKSYGSPNEAWYYLISAIFPE